MAYPEPVAKLGSTANPGRPLERICLATQRVNTMTVTVGEFIHRFNGPEPEKTGDSGGPDETRVPYACDLERLFDALTRLEHRVNQLADIG